MYKTDIKFMKEHSHQLKNCISKAADDARPQQMTNQYEATVLIQKTPAHKTSKRNKCDNLMATTKNPQVVQKQRLSIHYSFGYKSSRYMPMQAQRYSSNPFATSALDRGWWSASRSELFYHQERPSTHCTVGWVGFGAGRLI